MDRKKKRGSGGLVYSTGPSPIDWNDNSNASGEHASEPREAVLRMERSGRSGKTVTVVELRGVSSDEARAIEKRLKNACGTGGTTKGVIVELQGDLRERLRGLLEKEGLRVKG
ncbi:MAG: translation initiation factor [bacterium]